MTAMAAKRGEEDSVAEVSTVCMVAPVDGRGLLSTTNATTSVRNR